MKIDEMYLEAERLWDEAGSLKQSDFENEDTDFYGMDFESEKQSLTKQAHQLDMTFISAFEKLLKDNGYSFKYDIAQTTSKYYTVWHEDDEERDIVIRFADHQQLYNADYSVDPCGLSIDQLINMINDKSL